MSISVGLNMWNYDCPGIKIQNVENISMVLLTFCSDH